MNAIDASVRTAIMSSYLQARQAPPTWLTYPVIFHLGLRERMQREPTPVKPNRRTRRYAARPR